MSKKLYILLVVLVIVTFALTACGGATVDNGGSTSPSTSTPALGEGLIGDAIDEFFGNERDCPGIVC
jgi:hypothetical protein